MNKINNMRAQLLLKVKYEMEMSSMIKAILSNSPSYTEIWKCNVCKSSDTKTFPFIELSNGNDFTNLNEGIKFRDIDECEICHNLDVYFHRQFNNLLFIMMDGSGEEFRLRDIPDVIAIKEKYILFGAMLNISPLFENDVGHYVGAIKLNETWTIFDDKKTKPMLVSKHNIFIVHTLLYTKKADLSTKSTLSRKATENASENAHLPKAKLKRLSKGRAAKNSAKRVPLENAKTKLKRLSNDRARKSAAKRVVYLENAPNSKQNFAVKFISNSNQRPVCASTPNAEIKRLNKENVKKKSITQSLNSQIVPNVRQESFRESSSKGRFIHFR